MTGFRPAAGVAVVEEGDVVYAAHLPRGPIVVLDGVAGVIWEEACAGPASTIAERVAEVTDAAAGDIRADVDAFVAELVQQDLLAPTEP